MNTLLTLLNGYLKGTSEAGLQLDAKRMERVFLFCTTWALGGLLDIKVGTSVLCVSACTSTQILGIRLQGARFPVLLHVGPGKPLWR